MSSHDARASKPFRIAIVAPIFEGAYKEVLDAYLAKMRATVPGVKLLVNIMNLQTEPGFSIEPLIDEILWCKPDFVVSLGVACTSLLHARMKALGVKTPLLAMLIAERFIKDVGFFQGNSERAVVMEAQYPFTQIVEHLRATCPTVQKVAIPAQLFHGTNNEKNHGFVFSELLKNLDRHDIAYELVKFSSEKELVRFFEKNILAYDGIALFQALFLDRLAFMLGKLCKRYGKVLFAGSASAIKEGYASAGYATNRLEAGLVAADITKAYIQDGASLRSFGLVSVSITIELFGEVLSENVLCKTKAGNTLGANSNQSLLERFVVCNTQRAYSGGG